MKTTITRDRQTLFDVALTCFGRAEAAVDIAILNDLTLSDTLTPGVTLNLPDSVPRTDQAVVDAYALNSINPATALDAETEQQLDPEGIGYWYITKPTPAFKVS